MISDSTDLIVLQSSNFPRVSFAKAQNDSIWHIDIFDKKQFLFNIK